ncbi:chromatin modification- protein eaf6 [Lunasporangiospora selenospora]|uniref:Chromatin modification-related protein EAF6 n=1 Tax=Lunasporangiospora selenospora TaxID=979761 RepID=A0A9P6G4L6_9FUNG|nr:chromatin modification- protein eaf6 [Lunasporangiospora selenospora]
MPDVPKEKVTHQQYVDAKNELNELMTRKKVVDRNLAALENSIYAFEGSYLEDTQHGGNIIRGFDGYINPKAEKTRTKYTDADRLFSMSSTTFTKALQIKDNGDQESSQDEMKRSSVPVPSSSSSKRPSSKNPSSSSNIAPSSSLASGTGASSSSGSAAGAGNSSSLSGSGGSSSSLSRRHLKQQKALSQSSKNSSSGGGSGGAANSGAEGKPPKKMRLSSTADGDEDLDV